MGEGPLRAAELLDRDGRRGWLGLHYPASVGGGGKGLFHSVVLLEELGRTGYGGLRAAVGVHSYMATAYLARAGSEALKQRYLAPAIRGEKIGALALTEADAGTDVGRLTTTATLDGAHYVVNGRKKFIVNGTTGDFLTLAARTGPATRRGMGGLSFIVVDADSPGISRRPMDNLGWHSSDTAEIVLEDVRVPAENVIGAPNEGFPLHDAVLPAGAAGGGDPGARRHRPLPGHHLAVPLRRKVFEGPLSKLQSIRHQMAELVSETAAVRQLAHHAAWLYEHDELPIAECSMVKLRATELAKRAAQACIQLHGAHGYQSDSAHRPHVPRRAGRHPGRGRQRDAARRGSPGHAGRRTLERNLPPMTTTTLDDRDRELLRRWNQTAAPFPRDVTAHQLFEAHAARAPEAIAVVWGDEEITYRELNARSNRLAHHLLALGLRPDTPVAICLERSAQMVVAWMAALKAGGAYVHLDPDYPPERKALMLEDSGAPFVITEERLARALPASQARPVRLDTDAAAIAARDASNPRSGATPETLAYVVYTSGSTGRPKGIGTSHSALVRLVGQLRLPPVRPEDRVAQCANPSFDLVKPEMWGPLLNGGRLVGIPKDVLLSPQLLAEEVRRREITVLIVATALFNQIARTVPSAFESVKHVLFGGEAAAPQCVAAVLRSRPPKRLVTSTDRRRTAASPPGTWSPACRRARPPSPSASRCRTARSTCWASGGSCSRSARWASCTSAAPAWRAATWASRS